MDVINRGFSGYNLPWGGVVFKSVCIDLSTLILFADIEHMIRYFQLVNSKLNSLKFAFL
jgi:hypothetical protein